MIPRILIIAGSDSGGGAGIQADIKTVTMLGGHTMTAITAITAQNTLGVTAVHTVPTDMVLAQIDAVMSDIGVDAVKIGMIGSAETARAVAERLSGFDVPIVFDPVMIATSGAALADNATVAAFTQLMRIATVSTPNVAELDALGGDAAGLAERSGRAMLAKGGDVPGERVTDRLFRSDGQVIAFKSGRIVTKHNHGTGCTLASAIAVGLAGGLELQEAIVQARLFVRFALRAAPAFGNGHGPLGQQHVRLDLPLDDRPMLNHVTLPASDYESSLVFYRTIGLTQIVAAPPRYARFEVAGGMTLSFEVRDPADPPSPSEYFFQCRDLDGAVARLIAGGIRFEAMPESRPYGWRVAETRDPHGNRICLYDPGENRRYPPWRVGL